MRWVFLDSKPLGMIASPGRKPDAIRCRQRARDLWATGMRIFVPEICDDSGVSASRISHEALLVSR
jgi:hypothetical protein